MAGGNCRAELIMLILISKGKKIKAEMSFYGIIDEIL